LEKDNNTRFKTAFFQDNQAKPSSERTAILDFNEAGDDGMSVASVGPYANHLYTLFQTDNPASISSLKYLTGRPVNSVKALKAKFWKKEIRYKKLYYSSSVQCSVHHRYGRIHDQDSDKQRSTGHCHGRISSASCPEHVQSTSAIQQTSAGENST